MKSKREIKFEGDVKFYKCTSCGMFLTYENFSKNRLGYDGIMSECKECYKKRIYEYRRKNKEKRNEYQREYGRRREMMFAVTGPQPKPQIYIEPVQEEPVQVEPENIYEKEYPDAYKKIMSDEDTKRAFCEKYDEEQKINYLKREQEAINKKNEELEYEADKNKMRAMCDSLLEGNEKKMFEQAVHSLNGEWQDKFVHRLGKIPAHHFKESWKCVYDNILESKKGNGDINDL